MRPSTWRWLGPVPAGLVLQFVYGLLFANGVFVSILHDVALTQAVGLTALFSALGITAFGILLATNSDPTVCRSIPRRLALLGAVFIATQVFMAVALQRHVIWLLYVTATLVGIGSGSVYVVSIVVLQEWVPESPGMITGIGLLIGGGGTLFGIWAFKAASDALGGAIPAMALAGLLSGLISIAAAVLMQRPQTGWSPLAETPDDDIPFWILSTQDKLQRDLDTEKMSIVVEHDHHNSFTSIPVPSGEAQSLLPHKQNDPGPDCRLSIIDILADPAFFFVFVSVSAAVGPGFGFVLAFPRMVNTLFAVGLEPANNLLLWVTLVGVIGRILIGFGIDLLQSPSDTSCNGFLGAKRVNTGLLGLQSMALAVMPLCIRNAWTHTFALATAMVYITFSGGAVVSACLARSIFSPENSTLAFALLGVAVGAGRALFSLIVAACGGEDGNLVESIAARRIYEYDLFVHAAFFVSAVGLICSYFVTPSKAAYQNGANSPVFADVRA